MATEMISLKLDKQFLKDIDKVARDNNYHSRTEFIREALRTKMKETELNRTMAEVATLRGISKRKTTDSEIHRIREKVFRDL